MYDLYNLIATKYQDWIAKTAKQYWVSVNSLECDEALGNMRVKDINTYEITNSFIYDLMCKIIDKTITEESEKELLKKLIFCNGICTRFSVERETYVELSQEAKDLVNEF